MLQVMYHILQMIKPPFCQTHSLASFENLCWLDVEMRFHDLEIVSSAVSPSFPILASAVSREECSMMSEGNISSWICATDSLYTPHHSSSSSPGSQLIPGSHKILHLRDKSQTILALHLSFEVSPAFSMLFACFLFVLVAGANAASEWYSIWPKDVKAMDKNQRITDDLNSRVGHDHIYISKSGLGNHYWYALLSDNDKQHYGAFDGEATSECKIRG